MPYLFRCKCCGMAYERECNDDFEPCSYCNEFSGIKITGRRIIGYVELIGEVHSSKGENNGTTN
jgi:anaerobic ribonucleoside-triphosphate reductase